MDKNQYLETKLKQIIEAMTFQLLCEKPEDPLSFLIEWLQITGGYTSNGLTLEEKKELENLRREISKYRELEKIGKHKEEKEESEEENENDDKQNSEIDEEIAKRAQKKKIRAGVSAEVYGNYNKKGNFKPRVIKKTNQQITRIKTSIINSVIFQSIESNEIEIVINAMEEKLFNSGETVIQQGDLGDCLYIVENGELECYRKIDNKDKLLKTYGPGESFGELALLYNAPRAATVKTKTKAILWSLDRETFNYIVKDAAMKKREKYEKFLKSVEILSTVDGYELTQICDALRICTFKTGEYVIREGEMGDVFYIIEEGKATALKTIEPGKAPKEVKDYKSGEYFGELALIKGEPRAASIVAKTDMRLISLDRNSFKRLLGPIEEILKRNSQKYTKYIK